MTIAINSNQFIKFAGNDFFYDYFLGIAASSPQHQFIIILPRQKVTPASLQNTRYIISAPLANNSFMWKLWLNYTLPAIARKHKADILINTGGICSLRTTIPQWLLVSDLSFINYPQFFSGGQLSFLKKNMAAFLAKASNIVTTAQLLTSELIQHYSVDIEKISRFPLEADDHYKPGGYKEKEATREKYAEGREYFLFNGEIDIRINLVNLLKAFSFFKKRQQSNMQLIIATNIVEANDPFVESLKTYKYRKEVHLLTGLPENELIKINAAAYAFIYPAKYESLPLFTLRAMQCGVPVITGNESALQEIANDAALFTDPDNYEDIADKMMLLFKDERKRAELISSGIVALQKIPLNEPEKKLWGL